MNRPFGYGPQPPGWRPTQLREFLTRRRDTGRTDLALLSVNLVEGVCLRYANDGRPTPSEDLSAYQIVDQDDLVMNQLGKPHGSLGVSPYQGIISPAYFVARIDPSALPRFVHYLLRTRLYISEYERRGKYMPPSQFDISWEQFRTIAALLPPMNIQRSIADYLDAETARIDALMIKKRRMMVLARERFVTLVSFLTQDGPEARVRHLTSLLTSGPRGWAELVSDVGAPFIRSANLQRASVEIKTDNLVYVLPPKTAEAQRSSVCPGDVVMGITGANTGWVGCVPPFLAGGFVSQHVAILRPANVEPEWLAYSLFSVRAQDQLLGGQYGGTKQQLGLQDLAELRIASPDRDEQRRRVETIGKARRESERLIGVLGRQIALLAEHRQALITAAVTGQLEIPGLAA